MTYDSSPEILSAEIVFSQSGNVMNLAVPDNEYAGAVAEVEKKLDQYVNQADKIDYSVAAASGILCGILDSIFFGTVTAGGSGSLAQSHQAVNRFIERYAKANGYQGNGLKGAIEYLEKKFPVSQDNVWKGAAIGVSSKDHHLADLAHHPTPLGLLASIVTEFFRVGVFVNKDGDWHLKVVDTDPETIIHMWGPIIISGLSGWLVRIAEERYADSTESDMPGSIKKLLQYITKTPAIIDVLKTTYNWCGHIVSDMGGSKNTAGEGMGIPGLFLSFAYELASLPVLKNSGLPKYLRDLYTKEKQDFRHELPQLKAAGKQVIIVILNEAIVRTFYFIRRLITQINKAGSIRNVDWSRVMPWNNRTIQNMLMISEITFSGVDLADAAIRGAIESAGNIAIYGSAFLSRVNYVGIGRLAVSVVKEASMDVKELEALYEKRLLTETISEKNIKVIRDYRRQMEELVEQYLAENLQTYLEGFDQMDLALASGDSDIFIRGNVTIQKVLGHEVQFETQDEFDALMMSDESFKL